MKLEGKVALVTGSGRGIGRAIALRLARSGADVIINDIALDSAKEYGEKLTAATVMDEIKAIGRRSIGIEVDVTDKNAVNLMFKKILDEFGHMDILVNNVGGAIGKRKYLMGDSISVSEEDIRAIIDRNLISTIFCCQAAVPRMIAQKSGTIVNMASRTGLAVTFGAMSASYASSAPYGAAKAGVIQYTRVLAAELGPYGIRVNCVAPGTIVSSRMAEKIRTGLASSEQSLSICPLGRLGEPEDIAKAVEFLCADSDFVTGQCIRIDGGRSLF